MQQYTFFVSCAKGLENILYQELERINIKSKIQFAGVEFSGSMADAYTICLQSFVANQVLLKIDESKQIKNQIELYQFVYQIDWSEYFDVSNTFKITFSGSSSNFDNMMFVAQKTKDAIVDQFARKLGTRPDIDTDNPDLVIKVHLQREEFSVYLAINKESLHRRGYRDEQGEAPLKESLAAALLIQSGWLEDLKKENPILIDPMCGSATFLIEAGLMAKNIAPGLIRDGNNLSISKLYDENLWNTLVEKAKSEIKDINAEIIGYDIDARILDKAYQNIKHADLLEIIDIERQNVKFLENTTPNKQGLIIANPPYGERLMSNQKPQILEMMKKFGEICAEQFKDWKVAIFTNSFDSIREFGFRNTKKNKYFNGALDTYLFQFKVSEESRFKFENKIQKLQRLAEYSITKSTEHEDFANKLKKNYKKLSTWAKQIGVDCYRVYNADIPTFAVAVDIYGEDAVVQEFIASKFVDKQKAQQRFNQAIYHIHNVLGVPYSKIHLKVRKKQKGTDQYQKSDKSKENFDIVTEFGSYFYVNFYDYLDTGLFLDHRKMRKIIAKSSKNKTLLNLFSYTCSASLHACVSGAKKTCNVDASNTYLEWGEKNYKLNDIDLETHDFIRDDCMHFLLNNTQKFDVIFLDPPTFSNSKNNPNILDIQHDHVELINLSMKSLAKDGVMYFSNNYKKFKIDQSVVDKYDVENIDDKCLSRDFLQKKNIHNCWEIKFKK